MINKSAVAGYVVITDTYLLGVKEAPSFKEIVLFKNKFLRSSTISSGNRIAVGKFSGIFIALPSNMLGGIHFIKNYFSDLSEKIDIVKTD